MRILFVADVPPDPNQGASGCDLATIRALRQLGHEVDAVWGTDMPRRIRHGNLHQLLELPRNFANAVAEQCQRARYDVIQVNQPHAYLAARAHRRLNRPGIFVNRSHGWEPHVREALRLYDHSQTQNRSWPRRLATSGLWWFLKKHNQRVLRYSDGLAVCSVDDRDYVVRRRQMAPERVLALVPGVADDYLQTPAPAMDRDRARRLLHVAQFAPFKAPEVVARVAALVLEKSAAASLTWVCDRSHHAAVRALFPAALQPRVTLLGWMPRQQLLDQYDRHGLFLFPSYFEGFALTFLEAMARGLCVLASRIDGMRQTIRDGENGFLFERGDALGMAQRVLALMDDVELCARVAAKARETALTHTWERTARELAGFYERLLHVKARQSFQRPSAQPLAAGV